MKLISFKLYFQMPTGLVFGPSRAPPPKFRRMKTATRKPWYWSQTEKKRKLWSKSGSERKRKAELPERKKNREDLSRKKKREDRLKTREQRMEEEKQRKEEATKKKAKRDAKSHHGVEQVDATIFKVLGRSYKSCKRVSLKSRKKSDQKGGVEEIAAPKWRHGMRKERRESWSARAQLRRKRTPIIKHLVKTKAAVSGQIVICSEQKTSTESYSKEDETKTVEEKKAEAAHQVPPIVDVGADYEADGGQCSSGDGAVEMSWPLPIQAQLEPMPPCMEFYQVRIERTI